MRGVLFISAGAVAGALARYGVSLWTAGWHSHPLPIPIATLIVNVAGSLLFGFAVRYLSAASADPGLMLLVTVGFCGSFTTMSSLSYEFIGLISSGQHGAALLQMLLNVLLSAAGCFAGLRMAQWLTH